MKSKLFYSQFIAFSQYITLRLYYQYNPKRLSACPLTIHALLHIADGILACGPVWVYWAFPMERYCATLQRALGKSRRFPYESLNKFVIEDSWLTHIKIYYNLWDELSTNKPKSSALEFRSSTCLYFSRVINF